MSGAKGERTDGSVLTLIPLLPAVKSALVERYAVIDGAGGAHRQLTAEALASTTAIVTNGTTGLAGLDYNELPRLGVVCAYGAGYEGIDLAGARQRGIQVANAPNTNGDTVADHALGLMLALCRGFVPLQEALRQGQWEKSRAPRPALTGSTVGVIGMGNVGKAIAKRVHAFDAKVLYHAVERTENVPAEYVAGLSELAQRSDILVAACPGGPSTHHIVNASVLNDLGPDGFVVNVARGTVVDTDALIQALSAKVIAGAALDVLESEPRIPPELLTMNNVILTPHMAGRSPVGTEKQRQALLDNLAAFYEGKPMPGALR